MKRMRTRAIPWQAFFDRVREAVVVVVLPVVVVVVVVVD
jgi:hypothetical protein